MTLRLDLLAAFVLGFVLAIAITRELTPRQEQWQIIKGRKSA